MHRSANRARIGRDVNIDLLLAAGLKAIPTDVFWADAADGKTTIEIVKCHGPQILEFRLGVCSNFQRVSLRDL